MLWDIIPPDLYPKTALYLSILAMVIGCGILGIIRLVLFVDVEELEKKLDEMEKKGKTK